jgi:hypothetical protein
MPYQPTLGSGWRAWDGEGSSGFFAGGLIYGQVKKREKAPPPPRGHVRHALLSARSAALRTHRAGSERQAEYGVCRAPRTVPQSVAALIRHIWSGVQDVAQLLLHLEWWRAYEQVVRPHESLLLALAQPLDRGGKRVAQRYRQRRVAMAAGPTRRRSPVREVLAVPLPPAPLGAS